MIPRPLVYLWTLPTTCVGLPFVVLARLGGGRVRVVDGVIEIHGPWIAWVLEHLTLLPGGASAMTLGHVVIGRDQQCLDGSRQHERVHVRQCERWGPFFIPAYLLASAVIWIRGGDAYRENPFEREAYEIAP
jgi:hypothetical protein